MHIEQGTSRIAFIGEQTTIKMASPLPLIRVMRGSLASLMMRRKIGTILEKLKASEESLGSLLRGMRGVRVNRREAEFSSALRGIVVPTRCHCGGVVAVQPTIRDLPASLGFQDQWAVIADVVGSGDRCKGTTMLKQMQANHTVENPDNFGVMDGAILFRDFGDPGVIRLLLEYGPAIRKALAGLLNGL